LVTKDVQNYSRDFTITEVVITDLYSHIEDGAFKLFKCTFPGFNL